VMLSTCTLPDWAVPFSMAVMTQNPVVVAEVYTTDTTPDELVDPAAGAIDPHVPVWVKPTTSPATGALVGPVTVAVMVDVEVPLSTTEAGLAVTATELRVGAVTVRVAAVA